MLAVGSRSAFYVEGVSTIERHTEYAAVEHDAATSVPVYLDRSFRAHSAMGRLPQYAERPGSSDLHQSLHGCIGRRPEGNALLFSEDAVLRLS